MNVPTFVLEPTEITAAFASVSPVKVPTDVMFPCAAVVTVPAVVALDTVPLTLAPATALAVVANDTAPDTFAPALRLPL